MVEEFTNPSYDLYRNSTLGVCLSESLEELTQEESLSSDLSNRILSTFDEVHQS